jgi:chromatin segregation and condensation protein Rec8/ScpA/Scc1 (kleisin family)
MIRDLYSKIQQYFQLQPGQKLTFSKIIPSEERQDKVQTLIPLLHLSNQRRIDLEQEEHFGEIEIMLHTRQEVAAQLAEEAGE